MQSNRPFMSVDTKLGGIYLANDCFNALLRSLQLEIRAVIKTSGFRIYIYVCMCVCIRVGIELDREDFITVETKSLWTVDLRINVDAERKVAAFNLSRCTQRNIRLRLIRGRLCPVPSCPEKGHSLKRRWILRFYFAW